MAAAALPGRGSSMVEASGSSVADLHDLLNSKTTLPVVTAAAMTTASGDDGDEGSDKGAMSCQDATAAAASPAAAQPPPPSQQEQQQSAWREVITFALPMLATLAADPLASLVDTAFVGHLGAPQLAGVGMATRTAAAAASEGLLENAGADTCIGATSGRDTVIDVCNDNPASNGMPAGLVDAEDQLKLPLLDSSSSSSRGSSKLSAAVSSALVLALAFSLLELCVLVPGNSSLVSVWGAPEGSALREPTRQFLLLRGLAAPVTVLLLVTQGVFRGLQDAKTPLYATLLCNALNIALEPIFIFKPLHLGVRGSALATAIAQGFPI
eukprot:gene9517-9682_t